MAINLGEYDPDANLAKINLGKFAPLPEDMEYDQFRTRWLKNQQRGIGEAAWEWAKAIPEGAADYFTEDVWNALNNKSMVRSMFGLGENDGDAAKAWESLFTASEMGLRDSYNTFKSITSNVKDHFNSDLTQEQHIERDFTRFKYEQNYFNDAREKMMESVAPEFRDDMSVLADFLDPTNLAPSLIGTKLLNKGTRKVVKGAAGYGGQIAGKALEGVGKVTEKAFGLPAKGADKLRLKGMYRGVQGAAFVVGAGGGGIFGTVGTVVAGIGIGEALGKIASKTGREISEVARVFSQPSSHARFLHRVTTDEAVSKPMRKLAARLYKMQGTKMYDVGFDMLVAGIGSGAAQVAMEAAKGKSAEEVGYATGAGMAMGSPTGAIAGERGSGKSTESFDAQGNFTQRSQQTVVDYLSRKAEMMDKETIKAFSKLDDTSKLTLATLDELSGLGTIRMHLVSDDLFRKNTGQKAGASLPAAYNPDEKTIFLNESQLKDGVKVLPSLFLHEYGHHFLHDMLGASPLMARKILESFEDPDGHEYFFRDNDGRNLGSIKVNDEAHAFAQEYAKAIDSSIGEVAAELNKDRDAYLLAQEIGAEQFSMMTQDSPNAFKKHDVSFRHMMIGAAHDALAKIGVLNPRNGAEANSVISKAMLKNKDVRKTYDNFIKERTEHYRGRADDIETGRKHTPNAGQTSDERFTQLFGGVGVNLQVAAQFHVRDQVMYDELMDALALVAESDGDYAGLGKGAEGSKLHYKIREIFGKSGQYNAAVKAIIDMIQAHIDQRKMMKFGYRSASFKNRSDYNPFFERSVTPYAWQVSPKKVRNYMGRTVYPNLKVMGYDADLIMSNAERLAQANFIEDVDVFLKEFQQRASEVLSPDGEGRINPKGLGENEMMVAAMGMKESFENIQNPKLAEWLSNPENKLKNAFKSYDVGQLAGLSTQNKAGFAFDYKNAKHNYMPALAGQGYRDSTIKPKRGDRVEELTRRANRLRVGGITEQGYQQAVDQFKPVDVLTDQDIIPATRSEMIKAIKGDSRKKLVGAKVPKGTNVGIRLDINAYLYENTWVPTIHEAGKSGREVGKVLSYDSVAVVDNATLDNKKNISLKIAAGDIPKTSYARINGKWNPKSKKEAVALAEEALANKDGSWTQVGFDPERHSYFYDRENNALAVTQADQVVQVGRAVFAKNATKQPAQQAFGKGNYFMPAIKDWPVMAWDGKTRVRMPAEQALKRKDISAIRTGKGLNDYTWKDIHGNVTPLEKVFSNEASAKLQDIILAGDFNDIKLGKALLAISEVPRTQKTGLSASQSLEDIVGLNSDGQISVHKDSSKNADKEYYTIYSNPDGVTYDKHNQHLGQQIEVTVDRYENKMTIYSMDAKNLAKDAKTVPSFGLIAYQAALDFAHNNDLVYEPDDGLTHTNERRIVSAMLSSVLKNKSYGHLELHSAVKGVRDVNREYIKQFNNGEMTLNAAISLLAQIERKNFSSDFKSVLDPNNFKIDFSTGAIINRESLKEYTPKDIIDAIMSVDKRFNNGAGISTAKRAIITATIMDKNKDLKQQSVSPRLFESGALDKIFFMPAEFDIDAQIDKKAWQLLKYKAPKFQSYMTKHGEPIFAEKDKDGNWIPTEWHHGGTLGMTSPDSYKSTGSSISSPDASKETTWTPRTELHRQKDQPFFLTRDVEFAKAMQLRKTDDHESWYPNMGVLKIATNVNNVWDFKKKSDREKVRQYILGKNLTGNNWWIEAAKYPTNWHRTYENGDWQSIEELNGIFKDMGYQGYLVLEEAGRESMVENLAVFDSNNVKLIKDQNDSVGNITRAVDVSGKFQGQHLFAPSKDGFEAAIGVAPKRVSVVPSLEAGAMIAKEPEFQDFIQNNKVIADTFGFELTDERPVIGGWKDSETNQISREASHRLMLKAKSDADLNTFAAITGVMADEVQDSVMQVRYIKRNTKDSNGREYHIKIDPVLGEQITSLQFLERYGLEGGFTYDPKDEKLIFATWDEKGWSQVGDLIAAVTELGGLQGLDEASATISFPEIKDYRSLLSPARIKRYYGGTNRKPIRDLAEQARTKLEEHDRAGTLFMPATATQRAATKKSEMVFPTTTYVNSVEKGDSLTAKSENWDEAGWDKYFEDQKLADALLNQLSNDFTTQGWQDVNEVRTGRISKAEFPTAPTQVLDWLNDPMKLVEFIETARQKNPKLVQLAEQGVIAAKTNYGAKKTPEVVAQSFIWGFLSRMLDPYNQEAGWLRCTASNDFWNALYQSIDGNFTMDRGEYMTAEKMAVKKRKWEQQAAYKKLLDKKEKLGEERDAVKKLAKTKKQKDAVTAKYKKKIDDINAKIKNYTESRYKKLTKKAKEAHQMEANDFNLNQQKGTWIDLVSNMFDTQNTANANKAGQNARQNINGAYSLLQKWNGRWNEVTDIFNSSMSGQQMREQMWKMGLEGGGIGDKVTSFVIATMADGGVVIMDRWQFVNCWINEIKDSVAKRGQKVQEILADEGASATAKKLARQQAKEYEKYGNNPFRYSANDVPEDRSNFYDAVGSKLTPVAEHALYRTMEYYFQKMAENLQQIDPQKYGWIDSPFAVHWLLWNIAKDEAVGHSSLDILSDIIQNNTAPQNPSQRPAFVQNYQNQPSFAEKNEYLPKENINRRSRFTINQGVPREEIQETRRFPAFGRETAATNTYFR